MVAAPTGSLTGQVSAPPVQAAQQRVAPTPVAAPTVQAGQWGIQIGALGGSRYEPYLGTSFQ